MTDGQEDPRTISETGVLVSDAQRARERGDLPRALGLLSKAASLEPGAAQIHTLWGRVLADLGRSKQSEWRFRTALLDQPDYWPAMVGLGSVLNEMEEYEEARQHLTAAERLAPEEIELQYLLGVVDVNLEEPESAISHFERAAESERAPGVRPLGPGLPYWLGRALSQAGRPQDALRQFAAAIAASKASVTDPSMMSIYHFQIGIARTELRQFTAALSAFQLASAEAPVLAPIVQAIVAEVRFRQGSYQEYWSHLFEAAATLPSEGLREGLGSSYLVVLGDVYRELGWLEKARTTYLEGWRASEFDLLPESSQSPPHPGLGAGLLTTYLDSLEGGSITPELVDQSKGNGDTALSYADALDVYQRTEATLKQHLAAVSTRGTHSHIQRLLRLAWLHLVMGRLTDAESRFKEAAELLPQAVSDQLLIQKYTAVIATRRGRHEDATKSLERARELDPVDHQLRILLADAHVATASFDRAEPLYREVLREAKDNTEAHIGLGRLLVERGDAGATDLYGDAISHLEQARHLGESTRNDGPGRRRGSVRLTGGQMAALSYSLAYARVKMVESGEAKGRDRRDFLRTALNDLERTLKHDPLHFQAEAARRRLREDQSLTRRLDWIPTVLLLLVCIPAVFLVQLSFFFGRPRDISEEWYVATTFGLLTFSAFAFYLRELLKVKVGGLEVEKSVVDHGPAVATFAMPRGLYPLRAGLASDVGFDEVRPRETPPARGPSSGAFDAKMGKKEVTGGTRETRQEE